MLRKLQRLPHVISRGFWWNLPASWAFFFLLGIDHSIGHAWLAALALLMPFAIVVHEYSHAAVGLAHGIKIGSLNLGFMSGSVQFDEYSIANRTLAAILIAGPASSAALAVIAFAVGAPNIFWETMLIFAITNLIPLSGSDGYQLLGVYRDYRKAKNKKL